MRSLFFNAIPVLLLILTPGCVAPIGGEEEEGDDAVSRVSQPEVWSQLDDPTIFTDDLERRLSALPASGSVEQTPWPGSYWPTWQDSINHRWAGGNSKSPAKKYELAFGVPNLEDKISRYYGIDSRTSAAVCSQNSDCDANIKEVCAKRSGATSGRCVPTWFGLCHAWAAASILIPEPKRDVVKNGVTFKVQDIKALLSMVHNATTSKFVSVRCEDSDKSGALTYDANGRPEPQCRDTNAGTFHLLLSNYIGLRRESFLEDRTFDHEVWNHPIRAYNVVENRTVSPEDANRRIGMTPTGGATTSDSGSLRALQWSNVVSVTVSPGKSYMVRMTGSGDADLYVRFQAPPAEGSYTCRPFRAASSEDCRGTVPRGASKMYIAVRAGQVPSTYSLTATSGALPSTYVLNPGAASLRYIKSDISYVLASSSATDGSLSSTIERYTHVDRYEYILEFDTDGDIIGGEWVGENKRRHPDFLWLPSGPSERTVAGGAISYAQVKELADRSAE